MFLEQCSHIDLQRDFHPQNLDNSIVALLYLIRRSQLYRENDQKHPRQVKHREFGNFAKITQGILFA